MGWCIVKWEGSEVEMDERKKKKEKSQRRKKKSFKAKQTRQNEPNPKEEKKVSGRPARVPASPLRWANHRPWIAVDPIFGPVVVVEQDGSKGLATTRLPSRMSRTSLFTSVGSTDTSGTIELLFHANNPRRTRDPLSRDGDYALEEDGLLKSLRRVPGQFLIGRKDEGGKQRR